MAFKLKETTMNTVALFSIIVLAILIFVGGTVLVFYLGIRDRQDNEDDSQEI